MSDQERIIKKLEECLSASCRGFRTCPYSDDDWDAVREALALLKEQEPVPVEWQGIPLCGACHAAFLNMRPQKYCHECGRRVNWE